MKTIKIFVAFVALGLAACGNDNNNTTIDAPVNTQPDAFVTPAVPKLGAQIDRMGRPAINTALNHSFDANDTTKQQAKDAYNGATDPSMWATLQLTVAADVVVAQFEGNLGVIDSLDSSAQASGCSSAQTDATVEQPLYNKSGAAGAAYQSLAGALADDELYVYTGTGTCTFYLGVEGAFILGAANPTDCGGRAPSYDVIDVSYTALAIGLGPVLAGQFVPDGIASDDDPKSTDTAFPFLGAPH
jgi:hypothetical protein